MPSRANTTQSPTLNYVLQIKVKKLLNFLGLKSQIQILVGANIPRFKQFMKEFYA